MWWGGEGLGLRAAGQSGAGPNSALRDGAIRCHPRPPHLPAVPRQPAATLAAAAHAEPAPQPGPADGGGVGAGEAGCCGRRACNL